MTDPQHVLVLGASSEIGTSIVNVLSRSGAIVTASGRTLERVVQMRQKVPQKVSVLQADLEVSGSREKLFEDAISKRGLFTDMVYAAGYHELMPLKTSSYLTSLAKQMQVNVDIALEMTRIFLKKNNSRPGRRRSVTFVTSIAHKIGEPALSGYSASKGALISATRALAVELAKKNVRVNTVSPGWVEGDRAAEVASKLGGQAREHLESHYPLGLGRPDDVAAAVKFLTSHEASWISGIDLVVDGGRSCV